MNVAALLTEAEQRLRENDISEQEQSDLADRIRAYLEGSRGSTLIRVLPNSLTLVLLDGDNARATAMSINLIEDAPALNHILPETARHLYTELRGMEPSVPLPLWIRPVDRQVLDLVLNKGATLRDAADEADIALSTASLIMRRHGYTARRTIIWTKENTS